MKLTNCAASAQLANIERLYLEAFPAVERKPFPLMVQKSQEGIIELLAIEEEDGSFLGLAITVLHGNDVLLDYFAVCPHLRGKNIGSKALKALQGRYAGKRFVLEIEDPAEAAPNQQERIRRESFYLKNGMSAMPYLVSLFGVQMKVLAHGASISFEEYHIIYKASFGRQISSNIKKAKSPAAS
jgi:GNAT superfamily N-acetyltransferase